MPPARRPEFEPSFGSRSTDASLSPRGHSEQAEGDGVTPQHGVDHQDAVAAPDAERGVAGEPMLAGTPDMGHGADESDGPAAPTLPERPPIDPTPAAAPEPAQPTPDSTPAAASRVHPGRVGNRWFRVRRRLLAACAIAFVLVLAYYLVSLAQVWTTGRAHDDGPVDAIVVMGAAQYDGRPSPQLAARLDHVVEIWPEGIAPLVVVTGGNIPGDRFTEAEASAAYLVERGVPQEALLLENEGATTYASLQAVADLLAARGFDEVLIVTDPYHALRSRLIADEVGMNASVSSTESSVVTGGDSLRRHLQEAAGVAVGRIIGFDRLTRLVD